jgi:hypothetical protein
MAWAAWPAAVLVMCVLAGILISLQFIVYGFHRLALCIAWMLRGAWLGMSYVGSRIRAVFIREPSQVSARVVSPGPAIAHPVSIRALPQARHTT